MSYNTIQGSLTLFPLKTGALFVKYSINLKGKIFELYCLVLITYTATT